MASLHAVLRSELKALQEKPLKLTILKNVVNENVESKVDMNEQLRAVKAKYYEIKKLFEYVQGRGGLVKQIQKMHGLEVPPLGIDTRAADQSLKKEKSMLKAINEQLRKERDELMKLIKIVSEEFEELMTKRQQYEDQHNNPVSEDKVLKEWSENKALFGNCTKSEAQMKDQDSVTKIIGEQEELIQEVTIQKQQQDEALRILCRQLEESEVLLKTLEKKTEKNETKVDTQKLEKNEKAVASLEQKLKVMEDASGVRTSMKEFGAETHITVEFNCVEADGQKYTLNVCADNNSGSFKSVELSPPGENVEDILLSAESMSDFTSLVTETRARIANTWTLKKQLRQLKKSSQYIHTVDTKACLNRLALNLPGDIEAELWLSLDYPAFNERSPQIKRVSIAREQQLSQSALNSLHDTMKSWEKEQSDWVLCDWIKKMAEIIRGNQA